MAIKPVRSENAVQSDILLDMSSWQNTFIWRNNTGMAWQGEKVRASVGATITVEPGMVILRKGRPVKFGLEGSADIIGVSAGVAVAAEVKKVVTGRQSEQQSRFQAAWEKAGGCYMLVRSVEDAQQQFYERLFS